VQVQEEVEYQSRLSKVATYTYIWKIFGPVLSVTTFESEAEAVELANSTVYGLGAAVFSSDASQCMRLTSVIDSGTVRRVGHTRFARG